MVWCLVFSSHLTLQSVAEIIDPVFSQGRVVYYRRGRLCSQGIKDHLGEADLELSASAHYVHDLNILSAVRRCISLSLVDAANPLVSFPLRYNMIVFLHPHSLRCVCPTHWHFHRIQAWC